jgi:hypothetical protein
MARDDRLNHRIRLVEVPTHVVVQLHQARLVRLHADLERAGTETRQAPGLEWENGCQGKNEACENAGDPGAHREIVATAPRIGRMGRPRSRRFRGASRHEERSWWL